jgi:site-specific recombinase XerD
MLLLLYAAGLRISEALNLNLADVDLMNSVLYIRRSKFYKTRLVPIGADLTKVLREYTQQRCKRSPLDPEGTVLADIFRQANLARGRRTSLLLDAIPSQGPSPRRWAVPAAFA